MKTRRTRRYTPTGQRMYTTLNKTSKQVSYSNTNPQFVMTCKAKNEGGKGCTNAGCGSQCCQLSFLVSDISHSVWMAISGIRPGQILKNSGGQLSLGASDGSGDYCPLDYYTLTTHYEEEGDIYQWGTESPKSPVSKLDSEGYSQKEVSNPKVSDVTVYYGESWAWISYPVAVFSGGNDSGSMRNIPTTVFLKQGEDRKKAFFMNNTEAYQASSASNDIIMLYNKNTLTRLVILLHLKKYIY